MFTIEHINDLHERLGNAETLAQYLQSLNAIGVESSVSYVADGHAEFFGKDGHKVISPPAHEKFSIAETSRRDQFLEHLERHNRGETSYVEMSKGLAESGVEKWVFDMEKMTIAYYDKAGNELLVDEIR